MKPPLHTRAMSVPFLVTSVALGMTLSSATALAQQAQSDETVMPSVEVRHIKNPGLMPYRGAYDTIGRVQAAADGKVEFRLRILSSSNHEPVPDLEVRLTGSRDFGAVKIEPDGTLDFPMNEDAAKDDADLISNQKKSALEIRATFVPIFKPDAPLTYADIQAAIAAARRVRNEILPWYWRLITPTIGAVSVCYPKRGEVVKLRSDAAEFTRVAESETDGYHDAKVYCANFTASEKSMSAGTVISGPQPWETHFGGAWF